MIHDYLKVKLYSIYRGKKFLDYEFSPEATRLIILVGIPFENRTDFKIAMKMRNLGNLNKFDNRDLSDGIWYREEASRMVNSILNFAINDKDDYGSVLLVNV